MFLYCNHFSGDNICLYLHRINNCVLFLVLQLLVGNNNVYTEQEQIFDPPIVATKIRFIPYTSHVRMMCMRVELYGCPWTGEWNI